MFWFLRGHSPPASQCPWEDLFPGRRRRRVLSEAPEELLGFLPAQWGQWAKQHQVHHLVEVGHELPCRGG